MWKNKLLSKKCEKINERTHWLSERKEMAAIHTISVASTRVPIIFNRTSLSFWILTCKQCSKGSVKTSATIETIKEKLYIQKQSCNYQRKIYKAPTHFRKKKKGFSFLMLIFTHISTAGQAKWVSISLNVY